MSDPHKTAGKAVGLANLKPFKSGAEWAGNAGGRPKKKPITDMYQQIMSDPDKLKQFCESMFKRACEGDTVAAKDIIDRLEGKPLQTLDVNNTVTADPGQRLAELFSEAVGRDSKPDDTGRTQ